ncbi:MAG: YihA family ribosome biogenesis GTP-binding protein [Clostridia bacterium]|nr:YihA family ribosome biogenesis GTP-binding protein [Clostridia bacterium]
MRIVRASFVVSLEKLRDFPGQGMPEIAMAGKSNVGKSSLINSLCGNSKLARTSSEPGKTRLVNIYRVNDEFFLTDLPGYGFAKAPGSEKAKWSSMIEGYLNGSEMLRHVFLLVDIRHEPTSDDIMMAKYLRHYKIPFSVIATKADKLSKAARGRNLPVICRALAVQPWQIIPYSSEDLTGKDKLLERIEGILHPVEEVQADIEIPEGITFEDGPTREE